MLARPYYDAERHSITLGDGTTARQHFTLDDQGRRTEIVRYGIDQEVVDRKRVTFDERGNVNQISYFDRNGIAMDGPNKCARVDGTYDDHDRLVDERCSDARGRTALGHDRVSRTATRFDARGRMVEQRFYGTDDKLTNNNDNVARIVSDFDRYDRVVERRFYATDGTTPAMHRLGYSRRTIEYDPRGNPVAIAYYGPDGKTLMKQAGGYARQRREYDNRDLLHTVAFEDEHGDPVAIADGVARLVLYYDVSGDETRRETLGKHGEKLTTTLALVDLDHLDASNRAVVVIATDGASKRAGVYPDDVVLTRAGQLVQANVIVHGKLRLGVGRARLRLLRWRQGSTTERTVEVPANAEITVAHVPSFAP